MSMLDVFNNDIFGMVSLTTAIEHLPEQPSKLGDMGLFEDEPITTTTAVFEESFGKLALIQTSPRGSRGQEQPHEKRKTRAFAVPHIEVEDEILADSVQNIRSFGNTDVTNALAQVMNTRLQKMKNNIDATREWHRVGAVQGLIKDADGSTIFDLFAEFGITQQTITFDFSYTAPAVDIKTNATKLRRILEHSLGGTPFTGISMMCGDDFWDAFISCKNVKEAYLNWANSTIPTLQRGGFVFDDITWWNYSTKIGSTFLVPTANAWAIPTGALGLFKQFLSPADYEETVNTLGKPYYAKQEPKRWGKGRDLQAQTNALNMCTRPGVVPKASFTT